MTQREMIKSWLLHLDQDDLEFLLEIAKEYPWCDRYEDDSHCNNDAFITPIIELYGMELLDFQNCCIDELGIDYDEDSDIFPDLILALIAWLSYPKNVKTYKVLAKINDLEKDFKDA